MTFTQWLICYFVVFPICCFVGFMAGFAYPLPIKAGEFIPVRRDWRGQIAGA